MNSRNKGAAVWKDIVNYEGLYQVSNTGEVRSLPRETTKGRIIKQYVNKRNGYCYVSLSKENKRISKRVHKLVCRAFIQNIKDGYDKSYTIDHINGDKTDNSVENLEVCTQSENQKRAYDLGLQVAFGKKIINLDTMEIYNSYSEAARAIGASKGEMVARVCKGERSHYKNNHFAHLEDYKNNRIPAFKGKFKKGASVSLWR